MAFTGDQHTRYLIATRMMESTCQRYSAGVHLLCSNFSTSFTLPEGINSLPGTLLSEYADIIGKYKRFSFQVRFENNRIIVRID